MDPLQNKNNQALHMPSSSSSSALSSTGNVLAHFLSTGRLFPPGKIKKIKQDAREELDLIFERNFPPGRVRKASSSTLLTNQPTLLPSPSITLPPTPPNWEACMEETTNSLSTFKRFAVDPNSLEYETLVNLLKPTTVVSINKVTNPTLWREYKSRRNDLLLAKSEDGQVLMALGMSEAGANARVQSAEDGSRDILLSTDEGKYCVNEALLFHCTGSVENVEKIFEEGLDNRIKVRNGVLLGNGIYFADDPKKSIQYAGTSRTIMIFAVILGDCKNLATGSSVASSFLREPKKDEREKRNKEDLFFDSITARPTAYNEYVIYNKSQCCPIYEVQFRENFSTVKTEYSAARGETPNIAWTQQYRHNQPSHFMPNQQRIPEWPFFTSTLFKRMGANIPSPDMTENLRKLAEYGFPDELRNKKLLLKHQNNFNAALDSLLVDSDSSSNSSSSRTSFDEQEDEEPAPKKQKIKASQVDCPVCYDTILVSSTNCKQLACNHHLCKTCFLQIQINGTTMVSNEQHSSVKCPVCQEIDGIQIGTCPNGKMTIQMMSSACDGYPNHQTIAITYRFENSPITIERMAYLPDNPQGRKVLKLLKLAWDRRQIFSIGTSLTSGATNVPVWNIHHKTSQSGGAHGYPDATYFNRVLLELKSFGVV